MHSKSRSLQRLLNVHAVIGNVGNELRMRQRLVCAAHNSKTDVLISAFHKGRDDGVERAFVWREYIWRIGIQRKQRTTILQHESHAFHRDAGAEALVIA